MKPVASQQVQPDVSGIVIAALRGGSGKTIFSVGLIAALQNRQMRISPFKKGPDYIDAGWLALAAGRPCYNLDTFLIDADTIQRSFQHHTCNANFTVIEGNRGLYDCINTKGSTSTAELAKQLRLPVLLCLDATKITRTLAAVVTGCQQFDPDVHIMGVVLNRVAGTRHENIARRSIEQYCGIPVLGAVPKLHYHCFPERHMGLVPTHEHQWAKAAVNTMQTLVQKYLDLDRIVQLCTESTADASRAGAALYPDTEALQKPPNSSKPRIGILRDAAFQFYYPENLDALERAGAALIFTSPLQTEQLPSLDGLYIGGGFPETHAQQLAANTTFAKQIKTRVEQGMPIYAECGGLMYLGRELVLDNSTFPMTGVLPVSFGFCKRPQGHGYTIARVTRPNPYFQTGLKIKGHEFHYSKVLQWKGRKEDLAFEMQRGVGLVENCDGLCRNNVLATYTHIHSLGTPQWAPAMVAAAQRFANSLHR